MRAAEKEAKRVSRRVVARLPRGLRFIPTDEEIIEFLDDKVSGRTSWCDGKFIIAYNLYGKEKPWEIWERFGAGDTEDLYFFNELKKKSTRKFDRTLGDNSEGCWHGVGAGTPIIVEGTKQLMGIRKIFAYKGPETNQGRWIMHEYSLLMGTGRECDYVICRIRKKMRAEDDNSGTRNGNLLKRRKAQTVVYFEDISVDYGGLNKEESSPEMALPEKEPTDTRQRKQDDDDDDASAKTEIVHTPVSRKRTSDPILIGNFKKEENSGDNWSFRGNENVNPALTVTAKGTLSLLMQHTNKKDQRPVIDLSDNEPAAPHLRTSHVAENAVVNALRSANFNSRPPLRGLYPARSAVAEYLSRDLPYQISPSDVYITSGFRQALELIVTVLAAPGANILLSRPGLPNYGAQCAISGLEVRYYNLLPQSDWEIDLDALGELADKNTSAIVISNPGNSCGSIFSNDHLKKIAEAARRLGILVIADEVFAQFTFGSKPFVPMATFGSITPVITLGSISKKWVVPGWRLGWLVTCDPHGSLKKSGIMQHINACLRIISPPVTFLQGALPKMLREREWSFFLQHLNMFRQNLDILYNSIQEIACISWSQKPEGATCGMVKLDLSLLEDINDDIDFCLKLAQEESVLILPGFIVGMKNWLCLSFAMELSTLEDGLGRVKSFCQRHAKQVEVLSS